MKTSMSALPRDLRWFLLPMVLFWIFSAVMVWRFGYVDSFLWLNGRSHHAVTDFLGRNLTHLADPLLVFLVLIALAWKRNRAVAPTALLVMVLTGITSQLLKNLVFDDWMRPTVVCEGAPDYVCLVESAPRLHSFPSGHATTFAAGGMAFAWLFRESKAWIQIAIGLLTIALCYTRVHIGVHFLGDIFAGSMLGIFMGMPLFSLLLPPMQKLSARIPQEKAERMGPVILGIGLVLFLLRYAQWVFF